MNTYKITFIGCMLGAIGKTYRITNTVQAENTKEASLKLYDKYDHISIIEMEEITHEQQQCY